MRKVLFLVLALVAFSTTAQKKIEKQIPYQGESIKADFDFASSIRIVSWDNPTVKVETEVWTEDQKYSDLFELKVNEENGKIVLSSTAKEIFETFQEDHGLDRRIIRTRSLDHEFKYTLFVPRDIELDISSINGSIQSDYIEGNVTANLINGSIIIDRFKGNLKLESINGKIVLPGQNSSIRAKTVTGSIQTNPALAVTQKNRFIGEEVEVVHSGSNSLDLQTINGKIILN